MSKQQEQLEANRANAQLSTGPRTAEGKQRSSQNALKHGLYSKAAVLRTENRDEYDELVQSFINKFAPADPVERRVVMRMVDCEWRLTRARYVETATLDEAVDANAKSVEEQYESLDGAGRVAHAIQHFEQSQLLAYSNAQSQENRLHRQFERALKTLALIREERAVATTTKKNTCENEPISNTGNCSSNPSNLSPQQESPIDKESSQW